MTPTIEEVKKKQVIDQLSWDDTVDANDINVEVLGKTVTLNGTVPSYRTRETAEKDAMRVSGIHHVENMLKVKFPKTLEAPDDEVVRKRISDLILWDDQISSTEISVDVNQGVVTLGGMVETRREKEVARNLASSVIGVVEVENNLSVRLAREFVDGEVRHEVEQAFERNILFDEQNIHIEVSEGVVYLEGRTSTLVAKREADEIALYTPGVIDVVNNLTIG
jgi:osmotically-inducible protein OsmY